MRAKVRQLSEGEIQQSLKESSDWSIKAGTLYRELTFPNFQDAFAFMTATALLSEKMDHHPDWSNTYNKVIIRLSTHECGGISERDFAWAKAADRILKTYGI